MVLRYVTGNRARQAFGVILIVMAFASITVTYIDARDQRRLAQEQRAIAEHHLRITECQADFNEAFSNALKIRNEVARDERRALLNLTNALLDPKATQESAGAALVEYNRILRESEAERSRNPLPDRPTDCSG